MRHVTKKLLGAAAFCVAAGLVLCAAGWAMGAQTSLDLDWDGRRIQVGAGGTGGEKRAGGARNLDAFRSVDITALAADVSFQLGEDYGVELVWYDERLELDYRVEEDTLTVWSTHDRVNSLNSPKTGRVIVYLPEEAVLETVSIDVDMGEIRMVDRAMDALAIDSSMADVTLSGLTVQNLDLCSDMGGLSAVNTTVTHTLTASNSVGEIAISGDIRGTVDLENDMGSISLATTAPEADFGYDLSVDMGKLTVDGRRYTEHARREGGPNSLSAQTSMGSIQISFSSKS